jgi:hypothetical protein
MPDSRTERAETQEVSSRQQQHAHTALLVNNTVGRFYVAGCGAVKNAGDRE